MDNAQSPSPLTVAGTLRWTTCVRAPSWWRWPVAICLGWFTCAVPQLAPTPGLDSSWQGGLALAQAGGLHFGRDIVYTYGPLGFLTVTPLYVVWSGIAAVAFALGVQTLLCGTLLHVMRDVPGPIAVVAAYVVAMVAPSGGEAEIGLVIMLALTLSLLLDADKPMPRWLPIVGGLTASTLLLIKPNTGVFALLLVAIAAGFCAPHRARALAELGGSFVVALVCLWLATGNAAGDVVPWLQASAQFTAGYTAGMALLEPGRHPEIVDAVLLIVFMAVLLWRVGEGLPRARKAALTLAWAIVTFAMLKEGFVRLDGHAAVFFFAAAVVAATLARGELTRVAGVGAAIIASVWSITAIGVEPSQLYNVTDRFNGTKSQLELLADSSARATMLADARAAMLARIIIPPNVLRDLRAHTVDVQPMETSAVWTLGLHWRPQPDFQAYAVLTPALDRMNAAFLASPRAPERVLRLNPISNVDGRNPAFDAPNAFLALVCNYRETFANSALEVLARATNRCSAPRRLGGDAIRVGQHVQVPRAAPNELIYARLRVPQPLRARLRELVWKPAVLPAIVLDGVSYRLIAKTASGPLLMRMPSSAGFPLTGLVNGQVDRFRLVNVPSPVHVDFYAVRVGLR
jgi:hypothetical protein